MEPVQRVALLAAVTCLFIPHAVAAEERMETPVETVEVSLGEELTYQLTLHNPSDEADIYNVTWETDASLYIAVGQSQIREERATFELGPGETRNVPVTYTGARCTDSSCPSTVTFLSHSLQTDERFAVSQDVSLTRNTSVYGAAGIDHFHILVAVFSAVLFLLVRGSEGPSLPSHLSEPV